MDNIIDTLHTATAITNADMFSVLVMGLMIGCFVSDGFHALIEYIVKRIRRNSHDKTGNQS